MQDVPFHSEELPQVFPDTGADLVFPVHVAYATVAVVITTAIAIAMLFVLMFFTLLLVSLCHDSTRLESRK